MKWTPRDEMIEMRLRWLERGFESGDPGDRDSFGPRAP
jgi:predicted metalloprotease